jgi:probable rRNA maturation factor
MSRRSAPKNPPPDPAAAPPLPAVTIANRQRALRFDLARIRRIVGHALPHCIAERGPLPPVLPGLHEVSVSIVSESAMSRVHVDFLGIEGPTDVITFPYGEIVVCAAIAKDNARRYGNTPDDELALYIIHGLLHLNGFDDLSPAAARQMRTRQAKILDTARSSRKNTRT